MHQPLNLNLHTVPLVSGEVQKPSPRNLRQEMLLVGDLGVRYYCFQVSHPVISSGMLSLAPLPLRVRPPPKFHQLVLMLPLPMVMMVDTEKKKEPTNPQCPMLPYFPGGRLHPYKLR